MEGMYVYDGRLRRAAIDVEQVKEQGGAHLLLCPCLKSGFVLLARILADEEQKLKGCPRTRTGIFWKGLFVFDS